MTNMETNLDKALDDIIKEERTTDRGSRGRRTRGMRGRGMTRGGRFRRGSRPRGSFDNSKPKVDNRRRIYIKNLNKSINNEGLKKILADYGTLTRCGIHWDKMGESRGTADIEFETHEQAENCIQKLNDADINGEKVTFEYKTMKRRPFIRRRRRFSNDRRNGRRDFTNERDKRRLRTRGNRRGRGNNLNRRGTQDGRRVRRFKKSLGRRRP